MAPLPIDSVLNELLLALEQRDEVVLQAPPGAGKTTRVPLALLEAGWLAKQKILMLEPRRLAARAAAERMASMLNEPVGKTVGYRVRLDSRVGPQTRIEVVTEGILTRMLQDDPALTGVGIVIFDEFHERSLDADLGLALTLQGRELFREAEALKIMLMSATLDDRGVVALLNNAPLVTSRGRQFPVTPHYSHSWKANEDIIARTVASVQKVIDDETGSVLVFLPGQAEIRKVHAQLEGVLAEQKNIILAPLYGDLKLEEQRKAIEPCGAGKRKIVLATDIAETSLTIEGVRVVVDAGLCRTPKFNPTTGMTQLQTRRVSQASSIQRMGRAGRLEPGACYRLWSEVQQQQLIPHSSAEILQADLVPLALQLLRWGIDDPAELEWLDPPPAVAYSHALELLLKLGAIGATPTGHWTLTPHGERMARLPLHPRLAHMLLMSEAYGLQQLACDLAALLCERDLLPNSDADIHQRIALLDPTSRSGKPARGTLQRIKQQSRQFLKHIEQNIPSQLEMQADEDGLGFLIACAYPDRIAQQRGQANGLYRMSQGRGARLRADDPLQRAEYLAVAQLGSKQGDSVDRIYLAAELRVELLRGPLADLVEKKIFVGWDENTQHLLAEEQYCLGELVLERKDCQAPPAEEKRQAVLSLIKKRGLGILPWNDEIRAWQNRVMLLRQSHNGKDDNPWPDVSDDSLVQSLESWLGPYLDGINHIKHFEKLELGKILSSLLPWPLPQQLEELAPTLFPVPSGSRIRIDYSQSPPILAVKLQEMFGCIDTPSIANGKIKLKVHLLSPARRPLQVTQDLKNFWHTSYHEIKKEMKGRYPKHPWPDDPMSAEATRRVKKKPSKK